MQNTSIKQKKKILVQHLQQQFSTCRILQQYKISMHIKSCLSLMTEAIRKQMETTQSKSKNPHIYITKGQTEKSCRIFSSQWQFIANMDVKHSLIQ